MKRFKECSSILAAIFTLGASIWILLPRAVFAQPADEEVGSSIVNYEADEESPKKRKPQYGQIFSRYRGNFARVCAMMHKDGRGTWVYNRMLIENAKDDSDSKAYNSSAASDGGCEACRPLFKLIESSCKPKKPKKKPVKKGEEPAPPPPPTPKQRDPNIEAIALLSELAEGLASSEMGEEGEAAIAKFIELLKDPDGKTPGERDYFTTIATYFESPFRSREEQGGAHGAVFAPPTGEVRQQQLENLFE